MHQFSQSPRGSRNSQTALIRSTAGGGVQRKLDLTRLQGRLITDQLIDHEMNDQSLLFSEQRLVCLNPFSFLFFPKTPVLVTNRSNCSEKPLKRPKKVFQQSLSLYQLYFLFPVSPCDILNGNRKWSGVGREGISPTSGREKRRNRVPDYLLRPRLHAD